MPDRHAEREGKCEGQQSVPGRLPADPLELRQIDLVSREEHEQQLAQLGEQLDRTTLRAEKSEEGRTQHDATGQQAHYTGQGEALGELRQQDDEAEDDREPPDQRKCLEQVRHQVHMLRLMLTYPPDGLLTASHRGTYIGGRTTT